MHVRPINVRTRLTLWYVLILALMLLAYAGTFITLVFLNLRKDLDRQLEQDYEIVEEYITAASDGSLNIEPDNDPYFHERWFDIWTTDGMLMYASRPFSGKSLPGVSSAEASEVGFTFHSLTLANQVRLRIMSGKINIEGQWFYIRLIQSEERLWRELKVYVQLLLLLFPPGLLIAGLGGYVLAKRFLAPVDRMAETARRISEKNLQERLPVHNTADELGRLAGAFNALLERLQESFDRLKQFTSDAAHELRTPLTAIRSIGEVGLQNRREAEQYREIIGSMLEENQRLTRLVDNLLFLSRTDAGSFALASEIIDVSAFVRKTIELILPLAEEKDQEIRLEGESFLRITADPALLKQVLLNLLDNAIKYSPKQTIIVVHLEAVDQNALHIRVIDQGPGIPREHQTKIFERFYRVDKGRSRELGGAGLGLSIAAWAMSALGGTIQLESQPGKGSIFTLILPIH
ncbi:MAG: HAMP domain-containing protein [FCB group bacterium]|nr:HAMP domain-containing protein [FCB group bacterium]